MKIEKIYFEPEDGIELFGLLHKPDTKTKKIVISVHGMSSNCFTKRDDILANEFTKNGIAYFSFNNRGTGVVTKFNKKVFLKAPLHHHFEELGWEEPDIVKVFWVLGFLLAMFGVIYGVWL